MRSELQGRAGRGRRPAWSLASRPVPGGAVAAGRWRRRTAINVLMVNNPQMVDLQKLTADNFTKQTGITVNFTVLPENDVRDKISQEFSSQAGQYDVATLSATSRSRSTRKAKWLAPLDDYIAKDAGFDQADILKPMTDLADRGRRQDLRRAVLRRVLVPDVPQGRPRRRRASRCRPTRPGSRSPTSRPRSTAPQPGMTGICLRGQPGWGQVFAPLTTVVNTFGGTWFDKDWTPKVNAPEFKDATNFYVDLVRDARRERRPAGRLHRVPEQHASRATSPCGTTPPRPPARSRPTTPRSRARSATSPAPVVKTKSSGWLYAWAWGIQQASKKQDNAWKFISWASSKEYEKLVGTQLGWSQVPGRQARLDLREPGLPQGGRARSPSRPRHAIETADPSNPGVQPRPAIGIQFVDIPEFPDLGTQVSQDVSSAIAGQTTVDEALDKGQQLAEDVAERYQVRGRVSEHATTTAAADRTPARARAERPDAGACSAPGDWARRAPLLPALIFMIIVTQLPFVGDAGHLVHELERLLPRRARLRRPRQLRRGLHRRRTRATRSRRRSCSPSSVVLVSLRPRPGHRAAAGPQVPRPRHRPHDDDHAVPDRPGGGRAAVEARALQPGVRPVQRRCCTGLFGDERAPAGLDLATAR